jgi:alpha-ketoglutaric semialdehyde dehydrogenase
MSVQATLSSVIGPDAPEVIDGGGEYLSKNPANLDDVVAKVALGTHENLVAATE